MPFQCISFQAYNAFVIFGTQIKIIFNLYKPLFKETSVPPLKIHFTKTFKLLKVHEDIVNVIHII